jgi:hypothetical protein
LMPRSFETCCNLLKLRGSEVCHASKANINNFQGWGKKRRLKKKIWQFSGWGKEKKEAENKNNL